MAGWTTRSHQPNGTQFSSRILEKNWINPKEDQGEKKKGNKQQKQMGQMEKSSKLPDVNSTTSTSEVNAIGLITSIKDRNGQTRF